jgi:RNA polymerase sigma factor (sigma-70 family)
MATEALSTIQFKRRVMIQDASCVGVALTPVQKHFRQEKHTQAKRLAVLDEQRSDMTVEQITKTPLHNDQREFLGELFDSSSKAECTASAVTYIMKKFGDLKLDFKDLATQAWLCMDSIEALYKGESDQEKRYTSFLVKSLKRRLSDYVMEDILGKKDNTERKHNEDAPRWITWMQATDSHVVRQSKENAPGGMYVEDYLLRMILLEEGTTQRSLFKEALSLIKVEYRQVIELELSGKSREEMAQELNITPDYVSKKKKRAVEALQKQIHKLA